MLPATLAALPFPDIDPIIFQIGPLAIRWYALAYIAGLMLGWKYIVRLVRRDGDSAAMSEMQVDDFLVWATIGVVLGGRLAMCCFIDPVFTWITRRKSLRSGKVVCPSTAVCWASRLPWCCIAVNIT